MTTLKGQNIAKGLHRLELDAKQGIPYAKELLDAWNEIIDVLDGVELTDYFGAEEWRQYLGWKTQ